MQNKDGRSLVYGIAAVLLLTAVLSLFAHYHFVGSQNMLAQFFRFVVVVVLGVFIFFGQSWAQWGMVVYGGIGGIAYLYKGYGLYERPGFYWVWLIAFGVIYLVCAVLLVAIPKVRGYFKPMSV